MGREDRYSHPGPIEQSYGSIEGGKALLAEVLVDFPNIFTTGITLLNLTVEDYDIAQGDCRSVIQATTAGGREIIIDADLQDNVRTPIAIFIQNPNGKARIYHQDKTFTLISPHPTLYNAPNGSEQVKNGYLLELKKSLFFRTPERRKMFLLHPQAS